MKKALITITAALSFGGAFAQSNVIPSSGNVGIGNTNPTEKLSVSGNAKIDSTLTADSVLVKELRVGNGMRVEGLTETKEMNINGNVRVTGDAIFEGGAQFTNITSSINYDSLFPLSIDEFGNVKKVGIKLSELPTIMYGPKTCSPDGQVAAPTWANGLNKIFSQCSEVNVGIGTNSPLYKLDTRGTGYFSTGIRLGNSTASSQIVTAAFVEVEAPISSKNFIRLSVKNGSAAPKTVFKVENTGDLWCTAAHVRLADSIRIPDYVFYPGYQLMPLTEVKAFVQKNNHLPNVPSEAEIKQDGLSLEGMQLKLLEKVEELTLYVIQLEENNRKLLENNIKLEQRMTELESSTKK